MEFTIKNHTGKQNEKKDFGWQRLGKRRTKQSEKHVTVYSLENGFQVTRRVDSKREKGAAVSQRREHSINGGKKEKNKRWVKVSENPGCG